MAGRKCKRGCSCGRHKRRRASSGVKRSKTTGRFLKGNHSHGHHGFASIRSGDGRFPI